MSSPLHLEPRRLAALLVLATLAAVMVALVHAEAGRTALTASVNAVSNPDRAFKPKRVGIDLGGTVTWTNRTRDKHTVTFNTLPIDHDPLRPRGGTFTSPAFNTAGTFAYHCERHREMRGKVVVAPGGP